MKNLESFIYSILDDQSKKKMVIILTAAAFFLSSVNVPYKIGTGKDVTW